MGGACKVNIRVVLHQPITYLYPLPELPSFAGPTLEMAITFQIYI